MSEFLGPCLRHAGIRIRDSDWRCKSAKIVTGALLLAVLYCDGCGSYEAAILIYRKDVSAWLKRPKRCRYRVIAYARAGH